MDSLGEPLTRWTIRISLMLAFTALCSLSAPTRRRSGFRAARWLWSAAWVLGVWHVLCAFGFYHHWSHQAAWQATARDTAEVFNIDSGGGLLVNYAVLLCWTVDVGWLWLAPRTAAGRPLWLLIVWYGGFFLISFFATVVFEEGATRSLGLAGALCVPPVAYKFLRQHGLSRNNSPLARRTP